LSLNLIIAKFSNNDEIDLTKDIQNILLLLNNISNLKQEIHTKTIQINTELKNNINKEVIAYANQINIIKSQLEQIENLSSEKISLEVYSDNFFAVVLSLLPVRQEFCKCIKIYHDDGNNQKVQLCLQNYQGKVRFFSTCYAKILS
jgi:hypothetical protein